MGTYSQIENPDAFTEESESTKTAMGLTLKESYSLNKLFLGREPGTGASQGMMPMGIFPGI